MKQGGVKSRRVQDNGIGPGTCDVLCGDQVVGAVLKRTCGHLGVGIDQIKGAVVIGEIRRPDPAGIGIAGHVEKPLFR